MGESQLSSLLKQESRVVRLQDEQSYKLLGVKWYGKGVFLREEKKGSEIKAEKLYQVKAGDFIYNRLFAWKSSFAIVPEEFDGCFVSNEFPTFTAVDRKVDLEFLLRFILLPHNIETVNRVSGGMSSVSRKRFKEGDFLDFFIPAILPLSQQQLCQLLSRRESILNSLEAEEDRQLTLLKQLRQATLQEAVEGKLTANWRKQHPQVKGDPQHDAVALLTQINAEKERLIKAGELRKENLLPPVIGSDKTFDIPEGWAWCRMGDVCRFITKGTTPAPNELKSEGEIPFLKVYNIVNQKIDFYYRPQYISTKQQQKFARSRVFPGDILMNIVGPPLGKIAIVPQTFPECNINQAIAIFSSPIKPVNEYLYLFLNEGAEIRKIQTLGVVGQDNISLTQCRDMLIPLPPLAEQLAIVARVDSLMATIDALEAQVAERKEQVQLLMQAVLREAFAGGNGVSSHE